MTGLKVNVLKSEMVPIGEVPNVQVIRIELDVVMVAKFEVS